MKFFSTSFNLPHLWLGRTLDLRGPPQWLVSEMHQDLSFLFKFFLTWPLFDWLRCLRCKYNAIFNFSFDCEASIIHHKWANNLFIHENQNTWFLHLCHYFCIEWPVWPNSSDECPIVSVQRERIKYKWQCYHFTFVNPKDFLPWAFLDFAQMRFCNWWVHFQSVIMKSQKKVEL